MRVHAGKIRRRPLKTYRPEPTIAPLESFPPAKSYVFDAEHEAAVLRSYERSFDHLEVISNSHVHVIAEFSAGSSVWTSKINPRGVMLVAGMTGVSDALEERLSSVATLRAGWDGPESFAPGAVAVAVVKGATRALDSDRRSKLGASPHADGYIALTLEASGVTRFADVYADRIEYEVYPSASAPWSGSLNVFELRDFLES